MPTPILGAIFVKLASLLTIDENFMMISDNGLRVIVLTDRQKTFGQTNTQKNTQTDTTENNTILAVLHCTGDKYIRNSTNS